MEEMIEIESENGVVSVNTDNIPDIVAGRIESISALEKEVKNSETSAKAAMEYVGTQMTRYEEKGEWIFKHRAGNTKDIVEDTQEAVERLASTQQVSVNAIKKSFEFQKKLAETSKYLFELGCTNITANRIAVRAIEAKLNGASKGEISELARQEMMAVVKQLKEQEDILKKQEFLSSKVKETILRLDKKDVLDKSQSENIDLLKYENKKQRKKLTELHDSLSEKEKIDNEQTQRLEELTSLLDDKNDLDKKQSKKIAQLHESLSEKEKIDNEQTQRLEELTSLLDNKGLIDQRQEESIKKNEEAIKLLFEYTKQKDVLDKKQSADIESIKTVTQRKLCIAAIVISSLALICSIVNLILFNILR